MTDNELKKVVGGVTAALVTALTHAASALLNLGQIVGTAIKKIMNYKRKI